MKPRCMLLAFAGCVLPCLSFAQSGIPGQIMEALVESVESSGDASTDYESVLSELEQMHKVPLNINTAGREDLQKLPFLTDFQISSLLNYRRLNGNLLSIYELAMVYGYTNEVVQLMLPFVFVAPGDKAVDSGPGGILRSGHHEINLRMQRMLQVAEGYRKYDSIAGIAKYPGNPWVYYARYGYAAGNRFHAGITLEKDHGEDFFRGTNPQGFDFFSGYVMISNAGPVKTLLAGDYRLHFGQGLTLWNGLATGKSSLPLNIVKHQDAVRPFTSTDENDYFRGLAVSGTIGRFAFTGFYSYTGQDANITDTLGSGEICFSSFQETGYHRTPAETADENSLHKTATGGNLGFRNNWLKIGTTLVYCHLDKYLEAGDDPKDLYDFHGSGLLNWGTDYLITMKRIQLFGETSHGNRYWATLNGALFNAGKYASFSLLYRYFPAGYYSMHSGAFSESSSNSNEEGLYAGTVIHPRKNWKISAYADFYRFPWLKYQVSAPAAGNDYMFQVDYTAGTRVAMFLRLRIERKPENERIDSLPVPIVGEVIRSGLRYHISFRINSKFEIQNRLEFTGVKTANSLRDNGFMIYQDAAYKPARVPLALHFRIAWFNTGSYESRIYAYEQDLISGFSFPPMYDVGYRTYLMARYDIHDRASIRVRFAHTYYSNKTSFGTGLDEISTPSRSEVKLQLSLRF
jgi:hypothetical protein